MFPENKHLEDAFFRCIDVSFPFIEKMVMSCFQIRTPLFFGKRRHKDALIKVIRAVNAAVIQAAVYDYLFREFRRHRIDETGLFYYRQQVQDFFQKVQETTPLLLQFNASFLFAFMTTRRDQIFDPWDTIFEITPLVVREANVCYGLKANTDLSDSEQNELAQAIGELRGLVSIVANSKFGMNLIRTAA